MTGTFAELIRWQQGKDSVALATVIQTWGSSPRRAGSRMAFTGDGQITGSVSGGCVEAAVITAGLESLQTGQPQLLSFGVSDESAWGVGLACGGSIDVIVKPMDQDFWQAVYAAIESEEPAAVVTVVRGPEGWVGRELLYREDTLARGSLGKEWDGKIHVLAKEAVSEGRAKRVPLTGEIELFLEPLLPPTTLVLVGGVHIAIALASVAKVLGYRTVVVDPRKAWGNAERFPHIDRLIQAWPEDAFAQLKVTPSTAIATLTHDPKLDDPALKIAVNSPAFYVGALGSRSTHAARRLRLLREGLTEQQLGRIHAPIGLDIGSQTPEEIALAILAEVVAAHRKGAPGPARAVPVLLEHTTEIHHRAEE